MSKLSRQEYLGVMRKKYKKASKKEQGELLNDVVDITGYHRTYAAVVLRSPPKKKQPSRAKRPDTYSHETKQAVRFLWHAANEICAERLRPFIPDLVDKLMDLDELEVSHETYGQLRCMSLATVKRIVANEKRRSTIHIGGTTKPGSLLKRQITVRYGRWDETNPGWCEMDTVAHCGEVLAGSFIYSLDVVDICSGWSEQAAVMGKGERAVAGALEAIRGRLPFLLGLSIIMCKLPGFICKQASV